MIAATAFGRMAGTRRIFLGLAGLALALCAGCASQPLTYSGFLGDYGSLTRDGNRIDQASWRDPAADFRVYRKVLVDEPVLYYSIDAKDKRLSPDDSDRLVKETKSMLESALSSRFQIATEPGPDTLRIRAAITEVMPTVSGEGAALIDDRFPVSFEDSHMEAEALDSLTAQRKMAIVDTRRGRGLTTVGRTVRWQDVRGALRQWAQDVAAQLRSN